MTPQEREARKEAHKKAIIAEYGQGPAYDIHKVTNVERTNVAGVLWFFQTAKQYQALKRQIAENRANRRKTAN